ncbi:DivIVA domain-containing protein [Actinomycetes bacterium KLBMP 9797]
MASQGQRFRRRALRRGYKVDEVDNFLDRVEATLAGEAVGAPVAAQEVHDVVFRVRFGGYDEWQVDLHLDRVERQLAELEERGGYGRAPDRMGPPDRMGVPDRMGAPDRMGPPDRMGGGPMTERIGPPIRDDRAMPPGPAALPPRPMPAQSASSRDPYGQYDEPSGGFSPGGYDRFDGPPQRGGFDRGPGFDGPPARGGFDDGPPARGGFDDGPPPRGGFDGPPGRGGYDEPPSGGFGGPPPRPAFDERPSYDDRPAYDAPSGGFDGFAAGRHGKADMTAEIRMPERGLPERGLPERGMAERGMDGPPMSGPPMSGPPMGMPGLPPELQRIDQLRRTFQVRRFGSGYDPAQVDRLFEGILNGMTGRGPMPMNPAEIDHAQFGLVPGGYFEAEVDAALKEVKDILRRQ